MRASLDHELDCVCLCALKEFGNKRPWIELPWLILSNILSVELIGSRSCGDLQEKKKCLEVVVPLKKRKV